VSPLDAQRGKLIAPALLSDAKTDLERDLEMRHLAVLDMAALADYLEPRQVMQGVGRIGDGVAHGLVAALVRTADDFDDFVAMVSCGGGRVHGIS